MTRFEAVHPPVWARGGHLQTILGHFFRKTRGIQGGESLTLPLPDGDALAARVFSGTSDTVVYLFHGLGGSAEAGYMTRTARLCLKQGHTVTMVNHRGCGPGKALPHRKPYHSGRAEDLSAAIAAGRERFPGKKHIAIGFSLSGNALLLLLSGQRGEVLPDAAISVNAPIRLEKAAKKLRFGVNRLYDFRFVQDCRRDVQYRVKKGWISPDIRIPILSTLYEFDSLYTAREGGFESREQYYESCSTAGLLKRISVPTILITAQDDPFVDVADYLNAELSPSVTLRIAETGGHMGYLSQAGGFFRISHWLDGALEQSLEALRSSFGSCHPTSGCDRHGA